VLLMPGNKGISFERLVALVSKMSKLSSDSQELMTARATTSLAIRNSLDLF
jgi:hypothetical protein